MSDLKSLDHLGSITNEMLGGLHADEAMRLKIRREAMQGRAPARSRAKRLAPALCCAALAVVCVGAFSSRLNPAADHAGVMTLSATAAPEAAAIDSIAAGAETGVQSRMRVADLDNAATVSAGAQSGDSLFAAAQGDIPMVGFGGGVYRMLKTPEAVAEGALGGELASVQICDEQPSLASPAEMSKGLSNVASVGAAIYRLRDLAETTAVVCEVDGALRVFQRVSYAGRGPAGDSLEETFSVRGKVKEMTLSGVGTLSGEAANRVIAVLLDQATLKSADASGYGDTLTVTLDSGLKIQLGVSGDTVCGCGGWSCPEFFEAFEAAL